MNRNEVIKVIKENLKKRSGKSWSVTGGRGTAYGWITIDSPPSRCKWKFIQTETPEPPCDGAVYCGSDYTPQDMIRDGSITSIERDPWSRNAIKEGRKIYFNWEVEDQNCGFGHASPADRAELAKLLDLEHVHHQGCLVPSGSNYHEEYIARAKGEKPTVYGERYWD